MDNRQSITIEATVNAPVEKVWAFWTQPQHITKWTFASGDWHVPYAENDLKVDGKFKTTMAAKDGSMQFDFEGIYSIVNEHKLIAYELADGRQVKITFEEIDGQTQLTETFDPEDQHPIEMQKEGWQSILNNFKKYTEEN
ncbi:polyketide cyclase [Agrobacterium tumefaciens]|nr:polyketide cyclase [Agrobacterium tumefaciens]NTE21059.1 polyketide cyclase [Agrobacterium tumefaciens]